jgi:CheY-like chemotaxis protein
MGEGVVFQEHILGLTADRLVRAASLTPGLRTIREDGSPLPAEMLPPTVTLRTAQSQSGVIMGIHKPHGPLISIDSHPVLPEGQPQPEGQRSVLGTRAAAARILVVDDEAGVRSYLRAVLEDVGYIVSEAADGKEAIRLALSQPLDLVITDLVMPEQEGIETIQVLRRRVPGVGIIAISGAFGGRFLTTAKMLGADMVLGKPVSAELLLAKVEEVLIERR